MGREGEAEKGRGQFEGNLAKLRCSSRMRASAWFRYVYAFLCVCVCVCVCLGLVGSSRRAWSKQKTVNYVTTLKNMAVSMVRKVFEQII